MAVNFRNILVSNTQHSNPEHCIKLTRNPSTHAYYTLKTKLENCDGGWMNKFLHLGGLESLLDALEQLSGKEFTNFGDAVLQLDCLACVRAVLNNHEGMMYLLRPEELVRKLVIALDTPNALPKKQLYEVLTAVAVFSSRGHQLVTEGFQHFQKLCHQSSEYSQVLTELQETDTATFRRSLVAFFNAIISGHKDLHDRCRVRSQLIGLGLLDSLDKFRKEEQDAELFIQLEVFFEAKHKDEEMLERTHTFDYEQPSQVFKAILQEVAGKSEASTNFLHVLQDLYLLQTTSCTHKSTLWRTLEKTTHHITSLADDSDAQQFLSKFEKLVDSEKCEGERKTSKPADKQNPLLRDKVTNQNAQNKVKTSKAPPSPEMESRRDSGISVSSNNSSFYDNVKDGGVFKRQGSGRGSFNNSKVPRLESVEEEGSKKLPAPRQPVKSVHWAKIKHEEANRPLSVWRQMKEGLPRKTGGPLDFTALEKEFADLETGIPAADDELQILSGEQSLKLNLFLSRLEATPDGLAECLLEGDTDDLGVRGLRALLKVMPTEDEVHQLRGYQGARFDLAPAEQFLLALSDFPEWCLLLEGLALKAEFSVSLLRLSSQLKSLITATRDVMHHPGLRDFLRLLLEAGNFLNSGNHIGRAQGIQLDTLAKVAEVKGQSYYSSLLSSVIQQIEAKDEGTLLFVNDFPTLEVAAGTNIVDIRAEVNQMNAQLKKFLTQLSGASPKMKDMFDFSLEDIKKDMQGLHDNLTQLRSLSNQMAQYFCEDTMGFDLQKCLKHVLSFCALVKRCRKETARNLKQSKIAAAKKQLLELQKKDSKEAREFGIKAEACSSFAAPPTEAVLDNLIKDINCGKFSHHHDDDPLTLDDQESSLMLSHIQASTPCKGMPEESICSLAMNDIQVQSTRKTYVDRVERIIAQQYHRDKQMTTASYLDPEDLADQDKDATLTEANPLQIKFYPKVVERPNQLPLATNHNADIKRHRRTNSDLNHSTRADEKWRTYQKEAGVVMRLDRDQSESKNVLISLGLEKEGRALQADDVEELEKTLTCEDKPEEKPKKRSSFGFLRRFSTLRATLTQRNSNYAKPAKDERSKKSKGKGKRDSNKENVGIDE